MTDKRSGKYCVGIPGECVLYVSIIANTISLGGIDLKSFDGDLSEGSSASGNWLSRWQNCECLPQVRRYLLISNSKIYLQIPYVLRRGEL